MTTFRLVIEDVFSITGRGLIITGTVEGASVATGDVLIIQRQGEADLETTVRQLQQFRTTAPVADPGDRVGILLSPIPDRPRRGDVVRKREDLRKPVADNSQTDPFANLSFAASNFIAPALLLPIRLETKLTPAALLIRIYPDDIHIDSQDATLSPGEFADGQAYWTTLAADPAQAGSALAALEQAHGPARAWHIQQATANGAQPKLRAEDAVIAAPAIARALPHQFMAIATSDAGQQFSAMGQTVPETLPVAPSAEASPFEPEAEIAWLREFAEAEAVGMAIRLPLSTTAAQQGLKTLIVFGLGKHEAGNGVISELWANQAAGVGLSTVTPLSNTKGAGGGPAFGIALRDALGKMGAKGLKKHKAPETRLVEALDLPTPLPLRSPAANLGPLSTLLSNIVWEGAIRPALITAFDFTDGAAGALPFSPLQDFKNSFVTQLDPFGPWPLLRLGRQPYGIVPVLAAPGSHTTPLNHLCNRIRTGLSAFEQAAQLRREAAQAQGGYHTVIETLSRHPIGQTWRGRNFSRPEPLLDTLVRAGTGENVRTAATELAKFIRSNQATLDELKVALGDLAKLPTFFGNSFSFRLCGELIAAGAATASDPLQVNYLEPLLQSEDFWNILEQRLEGSNEPGEDPRENSREKKEHAPEPILKLLIEHGLLLILSEIAAVEQAGPDPDSLRRLLGQDDDLADDERPIRTRLALELGDRFGRPPLGELPSLLKRSGRAQRERLEALSALIEAIELLLKPDAATLHATLAALLDTVSTRFDAWLTAEATEALQQQRKDGVQGLVIGGWGYVEEIRPAAPPAASYLVSPSQALGDTAALLARAQKGLAASGIDGLLRADLSAEVINAARPLLTVIRRGFRLEVALAQLAADHLIAAGQASLLPKLTKAYPTEDGATSSPVAHSFDGLAFAEDARLSALGRLSRTQRQALTPAQGKVSTALDALEQVLIAEGAMALSEGRPEAAAAVLASASSGNAPTDAVSVLGAVPTGTSLSFRVAAIQDAEASVKTDSQSSQGLRARLAPALNAIAQERLSHITGTLTLVNAKGETIENTEITLEKLGLSALDLAYLTAPGSDQETLLAQKIALTTNLTQPLTDDITLSFDQAAQDTLWAAERLLSMLGEARSLKGEDFGSPEEGITPPTLDTARLEKQQQAVTTVLEEQLSRAQQFDVLSAEKQNSLRLELQLAGVIGDLSEASTVEAKQQIETALAARLQSAEQANTAEEKLAALLGDMPVLLPLQLNESVVWEGGQLLKGTAPDDLSLWIEETALVRDRLEPIADLMLSQTLSKATLRAIQWPMAQPPKNADSMDWIGGPLTEDDVYIGHFSLIAIGTWPTTTPSQNTSRNTSQNTNRAIVGLLIDAWEEVLPDHSADLGLTVDTPSPASRPPQTVLVAVPEQTDTPWTPQNLLNTIEQAITIAHTRTLTLTDLPNRAEVGFEYGDAGAFLPLLLFENETVNLRRAACDTLEERER